MAAVYLRTPEAIPEEIGEMYKTRINKPKYFMIEIIFESHATTYDNEQRIASGHYDVDLSEAGVDQARELGIRRAGEQFDAIFLL